MSELLYRLSYRPVAVHALEFLSGAGQFESRLVIVETSQSCKATHTLLRDAQVVLGP